MGWRAQKIGSCRDREPMTVTPADDTTRDGELRALERAMGAVVVNSSQDWGGEIADDDDDDSDR